MRCRTVTPFLQSYRLHCHPGEGRDPFVRRSCGGSVGPGLRRDDGRGADFRTRSRDDGRERHRRTGRAGAVGTELGAAARLDRLAQRRRPQDDRYSLSGDGLRVFCLCRPPRIDNAGTARSAREHADRPRFLRRGVQHARHGHDVSVRGADCAGFRGLPRAADDRGARDRVSAAQRVQLLAVPVRRTDDRCGVCDQCRPRCRLVRLCAIDRAGLHALEARRHLGPDDHLHRGVGARCRGTADRHDL